MTLFDEVRRHAAQVAARARWVAIDLDRADTLDLEALDDEPQIDPARHFLDGSRDDVAAYLVTLTAINFGSGWFPELNKRLVDGRPVSGYFTVAMGLTDRFRAEGPWSTEQLRTITTAEIASVVGQRPGHELMSLFAQALRQLGRFLGDRTPAQLVDAADGSAQRLARTVATGMSMWNDAGFYKRAQILPNDLALGGVARFADVETLTIFADNLVPHVLRCAGILRYDPALAEHIDAGRLLANAEQEREIRACAVHACVALAGRLGVSERVLDMWLWNRGQRPEYKALPRHRARTVFY